MHAGQHFFFSFFKSQQSFDFFAGLINYTDRIKPSGKGLLHWQEEKKRRRKKEKSCSHQAFVSNDRNFTPCR